MRCAIYYIPVAQCTTGKFLKKLLGDDGIEAALHRLDRLTQDEARMTAAQTLGVVLGLVSNMRVVMDGVECLHVYSYIFLNTCPIRWQGINGSHSTGFKYVSHAKPESSVLTLVCSRS